MRPSLVAPAIACVALSGCAGSVSTRTTTVHSPLRQAQRTHEYPPGQVPVQRATGASASAVAAIRAFATAYINWDAGTVAADMRTLARRSIGQARAAMQLAAANTSQDYELQRGGIANSGSVQAIAPLSHGQDRYVVVTLERTSASNTAAYQGLRPAWHVALATVAQVSGGQWVLSGWQPEN